ncbi:MAG: peptidoglycan-associated lipoprotein [Bdellovibrionales bacterium RBG_16_40_8]|nr:MAG: peptidoglycan-associated lipoprotein [Bdellovibrionales bacterium RBG_16_40_8]
MPKQLTIGLLSLTLAFAVSCSKKVKEDKDAGGAPGGIQQETMSFNSAGSDSGSIPGLSTIHFAYDSSALDTTARDILKSNADWIKSNSKVIIQIEGHCDARGSVEYNLALGERRAKAVKDYLSTLGVGGKRMTIISYGKEKPLELGDTEAVYARNRRANFVPLSN